MTESTLHKTIEYEWIDILEMKQEDIAEISKKYDINHYWLEDCIDPNHLPKFEDNGNLKFFLTRLNTSTERLILNTISDVSTKLGIFLKDNLILTVHRIENDAIKSLLKEIAIHPENFKTPYQLALHLGQKIFISFEQENEILLDQLDKMENEVFLKNVSNSAQLKRLYRFKRKVGLNLKVLNLSSDWVSSFEKLPLDSVEIKDLKLNEHVSGTL